jgi:hypothetical protein
MKGLTEMSLDSEARQAIADSLAAIDLMRELLDDQRRSLEAALVDRRPVASFPADQPRRRGRKGPPTTLSITIDGQNMTERQAAIGLVRAIVFIGLDRVGNLGLRLGGQPLIVRGALPNGRGYHQSGEYWIATHSDTAEKRGILEQICRRLSLRCSVRQVMRHSQLAA